MDIEKLIERLNELYRSLRLDGEQQCSPEINTVAFGLMDAATALSILRAENEKLKDQLYYGEGVNLVNYWMQQAKIEENGHRNCQAENEKLRAELEQVIVERDAAVSWAQKYTESIDRPCVACKHNTGDYVCTAICGNCGPMGAESCKWEFDFSGELKED